MQLPAGNILMRLRKAYSLASDVAVAEFLGVSRSTPAGWRHRDYIDLALIARKCPDLNLDWLVRGDGKPFREGVNVVMEPGGRPWPQPDDDLRVPLMGTPLMGDKTAAQVLDSFSSYGFTFRNWIEQRAMVDPEDCFLAVVGDGKMVGMLDSGDLILVNPCKEIRRHGIYAFFHRGNYVARYIKPDNGTLLFVPPYSDYPVEKIEDSDDFRLCGTVVAAMTRIYYEDRRWNAPRAREVERREFEESNRQ